METKFHKLLKTYKTAKIIKSTDMGTMGIHGVVEILCPCDNSSITIDSNSFNLTCGLIGLIDLKNCYLHLGKTMCTHCGTSFYTEDN